MLGLALRVWLDVRSQWMIDGDEALFGIGAVRILHGDWPNLLFGVPYMGMLQSYLAAPLVALFGPSAVALRCVTLLSSVAFIGVTWLLAEAWYGRAVAAVAALLAAVPSVYFDVVSLKVWGSYLDIMVLGSLVVYGTWQCRQHAGLLHRRQWLLLGVACGLAAWANLLVIYYLLTAFLLLPWRSAGRWLGTALAGGAPGLLLGGAPLWWYNLRHGGATFRWLFVGVGTSSTNHLAVAHVLFTTLLPRLGGLTSPWGGVPAGVAIVLALLILAALLMALVDTWRLWRPAARAGEPSKADAGAPLLLVVVSLIVYLGSGFGGPSLSPFDGSGRYLLPLWTALPILLAALCVRLGAVWRPAGVLAVAALLAANLYGHVASNPLLVFQSPYWARQPEDSQPLFRWLQANDVTNVWINHWAGDQLMYWSGDTIAGADYYDIVAGHGINRFPDTFQRVAEAPRAAYVVVVGDLPPSGLGARLQALGVTYRTATIGPYELFLPLSRRVDPAEVVKTLRYPY